jgi:transketolase
VLYPCDGNQTARLVALMADQKGISYIRTTREKTPILYTERLDDFRIGGSRIVRGGGADDQVAVIAAGITVHEAVKAADQLKGSVKVRVIDAYSVKPIDAAALLDAVRVTGGRFVIVEDHWPEGGIGDAVLAALAEQGATAKLAKFAHLAPREMPQSGKPAELLAVAGIDAAHIVAAVRKIVAP